MNSRSVVIQTCRVMLSDFRRELPEARAVNSYWKIIGDSIADE